MYFLSIFVLLHYLQYSITFARNWNPPSIVTNPKSKTFVSSRNSSPLSDLRIPASTNINMKVIASDSTTPLAAVVKQGIWAKALTCWGVLGVVAIIGNAIKRLLPIALQPFKEGGLSPLQWSIYGLWSIYMGYAEGDQAFQQKFSPLVVRRAQGLVDRPSILNWLLGGFFSMGLFGATKKRMIISWSVTAGVFALVKLVKLLPYPWRSIVDGGVVIGLSYGTLSICWELVQAMFGKVSDTDPCFPEPKDKGN
jgi:hypothetical protein